MQEQSNYTLHKYINNSIEDAMKKAIKYISKLVEAEENELIASPSDIGIHNTLMNQGKLFFFDFEYGGLDDMSKLICDLVLQLECILSNETEKTILEKLNEKVKNKNWLQRYDALRPLNIAKWALIILNSDMSQKMASEKAEEYFVQALKG